MLVRAPVARSQGEAPDRAEPGKAARMAKEATEKPEGVPERRERGAAAALTRVREVPAQEARGEGRGRVVSQVPVELAAGPGRAAPRVRMGAPAGICSNLVARVTSVFR